MKILFITALLSSIAVKSFCQIEGVVIDKKRAAITGATIIVKDITGKALDTVRSDQRGGYFFKGLKPGKYIVEANATGFNRFISKSIEVTLPPEGTDEGDDSYYAIRLDIVMSQ